MAVQGWRVIEKTVTVGTGALSLLGCDVSFQRFRDRVADGSIVSVVVVNPGKNESEEFLATLAYGTPDTITRIQTISSTNANAAVSWSGGSKLVMLTLPSYACQAMALMKPAVLVASKTNQTLASIVPGYAIDGVTLAAGNRVGLYGQTTASQNGIYVVQSAGSPTRAADFSAGDTVGGSSIPTLLGTTFTGQVFVCTNAPGADVAGTNSLTFVSPQGPTGATGAAGSNGSVWRNGSGVPSGGLGADGDYYLRTTTNDVYVRASGAYSIVVNISGAANSLAIGTVSTLTAGSAATATITGSAPSQTLNLGIPAGPSGGGTVIGPGVTTVDSVVVWSDTAGYHVRNSTVGFDHSNYDKFLVNATAPKFVAASSYVCDMDQADNFLIDVGATSGNVTFTNWSVGQVVRVLMIGAGKTLTWTGATINWIDKQPPDLIGAYTCVTLLCESSVTVSGVTTVTFYEVDRACDQDHEYQSNINSSTTSTTPTLTTTLTPGWNVMSSDGTAGRTVFLPQTPVKGMRVSALNSMSVSMLLYSDGVHLINGSGGALSLSFPAGTFTTLVFNGTYWWSFPKVPT